jgi:CheY-like chemotaxis protein
VDVASVTRRRTVLIADDEPAVRHLVHATLALGGAGVDVLEASTGAEVLAVARRSPVDLVLLDVGMPELDGLAACRALKADPATARTPVVFLTARTQHDDRAAGVAAGADAYLTKPFSPRGLAETVRQFLGA